MNINIKTNKETNIFLTLLQILFIGLKLGKVITWSWWAIMSPTWVPCVIILIIIIFVIIASMCAVARYNRRIKKRREK